MKINCHNTTLFTVCCGVMLLLASGGTTIAETTSLQTDATTTIALPEVDKVGKLPLETAISQRRSVREFLEAPLALEEISQLLWAAQGITHDGWLRAAPSAGALYPLELYLVAADVESLADGIYHYHPRHHTLQLVKHGDKLGKLAAAAYGQLWIKNSAAAIVIAADYDRTARKYGTRAQRYVHIEVGHVAQNIYLQATALGLGTTIVGAFMDSAVAKVVGVKGDEAPLAILPLGKPR